MRKLNIDKSMKKSFKKINKMEHRVVTILHWICLITDSIKEAEHYATLGWEKKQKDCLIYEVSHDMKKLNKKIVKIWN